jgi:hypothetical protein
VFVSRILFPLFLLPQLNTFKGNFWKNHLAGPKIIPGKMISGLLLLLYDKQIGIPWVNFDFSPVKTPYDYEWPMEQKGG